MVAHGRYASVEPALPQHNEHIAMFAEIFEDVNVLLVAAATLNELPTAQRSVNTL